MKIIISIMLIMNISFAQSQKDEYISHFKATANKAIELINYKNDNKLEISPGLEKIDLYSLKLNINLANIIFKKRTLKDKFGIVKCAINIPEKKEILVNIECWNKISHSLELRLPFVLHEYLGLTKEEVDNYYISSSINNLYDLFHASNLNIIEDRDPDEFFGEFDIDDIIKLFNLNATYITGFADNMDINGARSFWSSAKTKFDDPHQSINPHRDNICKILGFDFSSGYGSETGSFKKRLLEVKDTSGEARVINEDTNNPLVATRKITSIKCYHPTKL